MEKKLSKFDLYINMVKNLYSQKELEKQKIVILESFPDAHCIYSSNRGTDVGGMMNLLLYIIETYPEKYTTYDLFLKVHTKSDDEIRNMNLNVIMNRADEVIEAFEINPNLGVYSFESCVFDYLNIEEMLGILSYYKDIKINITYDEYIKRYSIDTKDPLHIIKHKYKNLEDGIDKNILPWFSYEAYKYLMDRYKMGIDSQNMMLQKDLVNLGIVCTHDITYTVFNLFWIKGNLLRKIFPSKEVIEYHLNQFHYGYERDVFFQQKSHAWERVFNFFAVAYGFEIAFSKLRGRVVDPHSALEYIHEYIEKIA